MNLVMTGLGPLECKSKSALLTKDVAFQVKAVGDDGVFSGYGSVFGVEDSYREVVVAGAFKESLEGRLPSLLWQHRASEPIGIYTKVEEDSVGLHVEGKLALNTVRGQEAYELLKMGAISGLSIGFNTREDSYDNVTGVRTLKKLDLWEVSLVTFPANEAARVTDVKELVKSGELPSLKEFERYLREAGFSKTQAAAVAGKGLSHLLRSESGAQANDELADILSAIRSAPLGGAQE
jgi:HK97 family phage prohead protease